jgi:hypothetical protein
MSGSWFSNRGQILQLGIAAFACILTGINAWPAIKQMELLTFSPIIFYTVFALGALIIFFYRAPAKTFEATPSSPPVPLTSQQSPSQIRNEPHKFHFERFTLKLGDFYEQPHQLSQLKVTLKNITTLKFKTYGGEETAEGAELEVRVGGGLVYGGVHTKQVGTNRYLRPLSTDTHNAEEGSIFKFAFTDRYFSFLGLRVEHINTHSKEVVIAFGHTSGFHQE